MARRSLQSTMHVNRTNLLKSRAMNESRHTNQSAVDLLLTRRSVLAKDMIPPGPSDEELQTILRCGLRVPDHSRAEPWRVQILNKPAQQALGDFCAELFQREHPEVNEVLVELERQRPQRSPTLLVVTFHVNQQKLTKIPEVEQLLSCAALCQNILVATTAMGYRGQWLTDWPAYHPEVIGYLGHSEGTQIVAFIHIGSVDTPPNERPRPEFDHIVSEWQPERIDTIRSELVKGEVSGQAEPFDGESFKEEMAAQRVGRST